jgi:hypothetical protein
MLIGLSGGFAQQASPDCFGLPNHQKLKAAISAVVKQGKEANSGLGKRTGYVLRPINSFCCAIS